MRHRTPKNLGEGKPQHWHIKRLRNSNIVSYNLPPLRRSAVDVKPIADRRFVNTRYALYGASRDRKKPIHDFLIARHCERLKAEELVSFMTVAQFGVTDQLRAWFSEASVKPLESQPNADRDSIFFGALVPVNDFKHIQSLVACIEKHLPLPFDFYQALEAIGNPEWKEPTHLKEDKQYEPDYFKNSGVTLNIGGHYEGFFSIDETFPAGIPEIHQCILDNNLERARQLLAHNPELPLQKDPWGILAYYLAFHLRNRPITELMCATIRQTFSSPGLFDRALHNIERILNSPISAPPYTSTDDTAKRLAEYRALYKQPMPMRPALHEAVINGQIDLAKQMIEANPALIEQQDPWGYTVAIIAAAKDQLAFLSWLLKRGAGVKNVVHQNVLRSQMGTRLIDNVKSVAALRLILNFRADPEQAKDRLIYAILHNEIDLAECLLHYLQQFDASRYRGLSMVELATKQSKQYGTDLLKMLLLTYHDFVPANPYDATISDEAQQCYLAHNERIAKRLARAENSLQVNSEWVEGNVIKTIYKNMDKMIIAELKELKDLGEDKAGVEDVYLKNIGALIDDSKVASEMLFNEELKAQPERQQYIHLFKDGHRIIAFFIFELIAGYYDTIGHFTIFHAKLAADDPAYAGLGLVKLGLRTQFAVLRLAQEPVYLYAEALFPGAGLSVVTPPGTEFSPKHYLSEGLMTYMASRVGVEIKNGLIETKFAVRNRKLDERDLTFRFFRSVGGSPKFAIPVGRCVDSRAEVNYLKSIKDNGYTQRELDRHYENWRFFLSVIQAKALCVETAPAFIQK